MSKDKQIPLNDVSREIDNRIAGADVLRGSELERLQVVRQAKQTGMQREQTRLANKLGADHPRVAALSSRIEINNRLVQDLVTETDRSKTAIPTVDKGAWVLYGFVRDKDRKGAPNLMIALFDLTGARLDKLGHACTDANGHFQIETRDAKSFDGRPAYIRVLNNQGAVLYADKAPLNPALGGVEYREITLSGDESVCVPPPEPPPPPPRTDPGSGPTTRDLGSPASAWIVRGRVTDENGQGLAGLIVSVYDRDLVFDDRLGETTTDENGSFRFVYHAEDFRDIIEERPDIFVRVLNQERKTIYTSQDAARCEAGRVEEFAIVIKSKKGTR
jgi:hypothetical protein